MKTIHNKMKSLLSMRAVTMMLIIGLIGASTQASPFGRIIAFGDSLAETGNLYANSGGMLPPSPAYYEGRGSNGEIWTEYLADMLGVELHTYAYWGAKTDDTNFNDGVEPFLYFPLIGLEQQIDGFLEDAEQQSLKNRDLFLLIVGANDFLDWLERDGEMPIPGAAQNTVAQVARLLDAGANHVVVMNVPDLAQTPAFANVPPEGKAAISAGIAAHNSVLAQGLAQLSEESKSNILLVDLYTMLNDMIANPSAYGLANTTIPALYFEVDPAISLFWDGVHPTTVSHRILAEEVLDRMLETYVPGKAIGLDQQVPGWVQR